MSSQEEEGWPLGLPPVALRMRLVEAFSAAGAGEAGTSFVLNPTPSFSSLSSSDLDTESTGSFFPEKTITLGSLIGIAGASIGHPSFRRSLGSVDDTPSMKGSRRFITRFAWCRSEPSGAMNTKKFTSLSNLIRCKSCRGAYDYPDDNSSIGAPPSLGHFLDIERDLETASINQAKVYINVMFEEEGCSSQENEAINPLFNSGRANSPSLLALRNNHLSSDFLPAVSNAVRSTSLSKTDDIDLQEHMPEQFYNHLKPRSEATNQHDELLRLRAAARSMHIFQKATALLKSKSEKHQDRQSDNAGICVLSCVSHIWGSSNNTSNLKNNLNEEEYEDNDLQYSIEESKSDSTLEFSTPSNNAMSCYTNFSFDDSDSSVYFDDEDDSNMGNSRKQNTADCEAEQEFEFCTPVVRSTWQLSMDENQEVNLAEQPCFTR